ncbi:MAG TPA: response regulator, partial [Rhabdochlamydiaceae bacterium]
KILGRYVEDMGYEALFAVNGEEAVTKFRGRKLSLVLMDVEMPVMNGIDATKKIREFEDSSEDDDLKRVPIVGCTSISKECAEQCREAGMDDCLHKPATREQVKEVFDKYVGATLTNDK